MWIVKTAAIPVEMGAKIGVLNNSECLVKYFQSSSHVRWLNDE